MQKAFDFLDRKLLFLRLLRAGVDGKFYWALKNALGDTSSRVRLNHRLSNSFPTTYGTRQGDPISPTNFSIFINDLLTELRTEKSQNDSIICNVLAYADDLVLISESELDLQRLIEIVRKWCIKYRIEVNIDKTKVVHYRKENRMRTNFNFMWEDRQIGIVPGYKYLGVFLDEFLSVDVHCDAICNSAGRALGRIISKFSYFRNVGFKTFNKLFECNVESVMSYGVSNIGLKEYGFEKIQSRAIRYFLGVHAKTPIPALFGEVGWTQFKYKRWICMCRTWNRFIGMDDDRVNKQIFVQDYTANTPNWSKDFQTVCSVLDLNEAFVNSNYIDMELFKSKLALYVSDKWKTSVRSKPKLRTYQQYKTELKPEWYVENFVGRFQRSIFARFRCGILPLQIELGRFRGQSVNERVCQLCKNAVETETHFLFDCPVYDRTEFLRATNLDQVPDSVERLRLCMDVYQKLTVKFIVKLWNERQNLITT